jgi:hypothetical protein
MNKTTAGDRSAIEPGAANGLVSENFLKGADRGNRDDFDFVAPQSICNLGFRARTDDHRRTKI